MTAQSGSRARTAIGPPTADLCPGRRARGPDQGRRPTILSGLCCRPPALTARQGNSVRGVSMKPLSKVALVTAVTTVLSGTAVVIALNAAAAPTRYEAEAAPAERKRPRAGSMEKLGRGVVAVRAGNPGAGQLAAAGSRPGGHRLQRLPLGGRRRLHQAQRVGADRRHQLHGHHREPGAVQQLPGAAGGRRSGAGGERGVHADRQPRRRAGGPRAVAGRRRGEVRLGR